jgi:hypothetical protein
MRWTTIKETPLEHYAKVFLRKIGHQGGGYAQWDGVRKVFLNDYLFGPHGAKPDEYEYLDESPDSKGNASAEEQEDSAAAASWFQSLTVDERQHLRWIYGTSGEGYLTDKKIMALYIITKKP